MLSLWRQQLSPSDLSGTSVFHCVGLNQVAPVNINMPLIPLSKFSHRKLGTYLINNWVCHVPEADDTPNTQILIYIYIYIIRIYVYHIVKIIVSLITLLPLYRSGNCISYIACWTDSLDTFPGVLHLNIVQNQTHYFSPQNFLFVYFLFSVNGTAIYPGTRARNHWVIPDFPLSLHQLSPIKFYLLNMFWILPSLLHSYHDCFYSGCYHFSLKLLQLFPNWPLWY